ncbi:MAG: glucosamine-6-phosphate isomerase [Acidobacteriia bacterium]|nr:glucosamine-6-phosphate isomerase [Terriglobia bacterium]
MWAYKNSQELFEWCKIPPEELPSHPKAKVKLKIVPSKQDVYRVFADTLADEVKANNAAGRPTRWILPCGPRGEYPLFIERVNRERISLKNLHVFHMDDHLDWQGRHLALDHPFSLRGWMTRCFYGPIDPALNVPEAQRHFPHVSRVDEMAEKIAAVGGVDSTYGGIGYRGHIAYNEPPRSPWYRVSVEEFRNCTTRILHLNEDTLVALSHRAAGGCSDMVAPMAITLGMRELLGARRIRLYSETGAWKQTVIRILLFGNVSPEVPVTYCQEHPDCEVTVDEATAACPPLGI